MNRSFKLLLLIVIAFLLASSLRVECRRTYSSRSSSSGRGNRGKNQPSGGGIFSSWFGGSKSSSSGSGSVSKPAPTSAKKNWQSASSHATSQSKSNSNWANPYYKPPGSAPLPSAPKESNYGWKPAVSPNAKPASSFPSSNIGSRGYPVQSGVQQGSAGSFSGSKPASGVPSSNYQPAQSSFGGYRPASNIPNTHNTGFQPSAYQNNPGGFHSASNYNPSQPSYGYQTSHGVSNHPVGGHHPGGYPQQPVGYSGYQPSHSGYSPHSSFGGAVPTYQGTKLFGGTAGHYGYPGSGSWGIDTYGARKSSGTGKLLTGLAVGAAGGYLTSSLVNSISNPWKYSGWGYGSRYGYGSGYDNARPYDESAFERGYERGVQARQNENNSNNKEVSVPQPLDDPTSKWIQCVAFDPQTQQTLINPNCSCTVTTSIDERTGQPVSVHHCSTLNGLIMRPVPIQGSVGTNLPPPPSTGPQSIGGVNAPEAVPSYGSAYEGNFQYGGGATVYLPPQTEAKVEKDATETKSEPIASEAVTQKSTTGTETQQSATEAKLEQSRPEVQPERPSGIVTKQEVTAGEKVAKLESVMGGNQSEDPPTSGVVGGTLRDDQKRTAEFYGQLQKIVNMGNFVDGGLSAHEDDKKLREKLLRVITSSSPSSTSSTQAGLRILGSLQGMLEILLKSRGS